jgi:hypothetical protein
MKTVLTAPAVELRRNADQVRGLAISGEIVN